MTYLFAPVSGTTPAPPVAPVTLLPDVTATDGGANTFFGNLIGGVFRFFGTSQAAPHAAGVAALLRQKFPSLTPTQIENAITSTATPMNGGRAAVGAGRINAAAALNALINPPVSAVQAVSPQQRPEDNQDKKHKKTEEQVLHAERTNRSNRDDAFTEGNVVGVRCDLSDPVPQPSQGFIVRPDAVPYVLIANRDQGVQQILLIRDAATVCRSVSVASYIEADGTKEHEQLFEAESVNVAKR